MKKGFLIKTLAFISILLSCVGLTSENGEASAAVEYPLPLQIVDDIDNSPFPVTKEMHFGASDYRNFSKFTIETPGQVQASYYCSVNAKGTGSAWISRDEWGANVIGTVSKFSGSETKLNWYLETGTYYLNSFYNDTTSKVNVALLFEPTVTEDNGATSFNNCPRLLFDITTKGFLTETIPNDYYSFVLTEKSTVTIEYSFNTAGGANDELGYCTLYDSNKLFLKEGTYSKTDKGAKKLDSLLEPGTYFIKLNGLNGYTTLCAKPMYYGIDFIVDSNGDWTDEPYEIDIETTIDYTEILVQYKDVEETAINNSSVWSTSNKTNVLLDGEIFMAEKSGVYSVRILDKHGNYTMGKIEVENIDVTKPKVTGVTNNKAYKKAVTLKWTDKQSYINDEKTTLNGKKVSSGITVSKEGKYTLKVYDQIGNVRTVVFYIDYTAPTAGVENGKTYTDSVSLKFIDNLSGIKKIMVDDIEQPTSMKSMRCYTDGNYTVKLWDNAGNYKKIAFKIKKSY